MNTITAKNKITGEIREFEVELKIAENKSEFVYISSNKKGFIMVGENYLLSEWEVIKITKPKVIKECCDNCLHINTAHNTSKNYCIDLDCKCHKVIEELESNTEYKEENNLHQDLSDNTVNELRTPKSSLEDIQDFVEEINSRCFTSNIAIPKIGLKKRLDNLLSLYRQQLLQEHTKRICRVLRQIGEVKNDTEMKKVIEIITNLNNK